VAVATGIAVYVATQKPAADPCVGVAAPMQSLWTAQRREALENAFMRTGLSYAASTWSSTAARIDMYAGRWSQSRRAACEAAQVRREESAALSERRIACLDRGQRRLDALLDAFADIDAGAVQYAGRAVAELPDLALCENLDAVANLYLGNEVADGPFLSEADMHVAARTLLDGLGVHILDLERPVSQLSGGQRQTLAIARAIYFGAKVLILDEPTSALGQRQQMGVLKTIKRVRARGDIAIIFITHNEIHSQLVADRFTFLALGQVIGAGTKSELKHDEIRRLMAGGAGIRDLEQELASV